MKTMLWTGEARGNPQGRGTTAGTLAQRNAPLTNVECAPHLRHVQLCCDTRLKEQELETRGGDVRHQ